MTSHAITSLRMKKHRDRLHIEFAAVREEAANEESCKGVGSRDPPLLIPFPLGLLATAVVFDIVYLITDRGGFAVAAAYMIAAGIFRGVVAPPLCWVYLV